MMLGATPQGPARACRSALTAHSCAGEAERGHPREGRGEGREDAPFFDLLATCFDSLLRVPEHDQEVVPAGQQRRMDHQRQTRNKTAAAWVAGRQPVACVHTANVLVCCLHDISAAAAFGWVPVALEPALRAGLQAPVFTAASTDVRGKLVRGGRGDGVGVRSPGDDDTAWP